MSDFLQKKKVQKCMCSAFKGALYTNTYNEHFGNSVGQTNIDILILLEFKEVSNTLNPFLKICDTYFKNIKYVIIPALGCTPDGFSTQDTIATYSKCKEANIKKVIHSYNPKTIITTGRAIYAITESKGLQAEHFFIPVNDSIQDYQKDDNWMYSQEFNCKVFPIPALYQWIKDTIKDVYEYKFTQYQFKDALLSISESKRRMPKYNLIMMDDPNTFLRELIGNKNITAIAIDTETSNLNYFTGELYSIQFSYDGRSGYFCYFSQIDKNLLIELFNRTDIDFVYHNSQFDLKYLISNGIHNAKCTFDTMLAAHLLNENSPNGLKQITWIYTSLGGYDLKLKQYMKSNKELNFTQLPQQLLLEYACYDSIITYQIYNYFKKRLELEDSYIKDNFYKYIMPAVEMIVDVEMTGVQIDIPYLEKYVEELKVYAKEIEKELYELAGYEFNLKSNKDLSKVLRAIPGFKVIKGNDGKELLNKNGDLTLDKETLERYAVESNLPFMKKIAEYNHITKEISQFGYDLKVQAVNSKRGLFDLEEDPEEIEKGFLASIHNGRLHGGYKLHGTETGRMSGGGGLSSSINWQNMPKTKEFRKLFLPSKNMVMAFADYCVEENTRIMTNNGFKKIKDINVDIDLAIQEDGSLEKIKNLINRGTQEVYKIITEHGYEILATADHRIRVIDINGDYVWKRVKDLDKHIDYAAIQVQNIDSGINNIRPANSSVIRGKYSTNLKEPTFPESFDKDLLTFLGYFVGDGTSVKENSHSGNFCIFSNDLDIENYLCDIFNNTFNISLKRVTSEKRCVGFEFASKKLLSWFYNNLISKSSMPEYLFSMDNKSIGYFLRGYFEADGHLLGVASSRESIIRNTQLLLLKLGIFSRKHTFYAVLKKMLNKRYTAYGVSTYPYYSGLFKSFIGFLSKRKKGILDSIHYNFVNSNTTREFVIGALPNQKNKVKKLDCINRVKEKNTKNKFANIVCRNRKGNGVISLSFAKYLLNKYPDIYSDLQLDNFEKNNQRYSKIISINSVGIRPTYDLTIENTHTYISDGFVSHNCAMEVSIFSQLSGSGPLESLILENKDMHCYTCVQLFELIGKSTTYEEVFAKTKIEGQEDYEFVEWRSKSKNLNFQALYGATGYGIANLFEVSKDEGQQFLDAFYKSYPEVESYINNNRDQAKKLGYVTTLLGRKRRLPQLTYIGKDSFYNKRTSSFDIGNLLNAAINAPCQGTSGQTTLIAMTNIWREFKQKNLRSKVLINVHDEIVFELDLDELEEACRIIKYWMEYKYYENIGGNKVTLSIDSNYGEIWKYGYGKKYWDEHPEEWNKCLQDLEERNTNNRLI